MTVHGASSKDKLAELKEVSEKTALPQTQQASAASDNLAACPRRRLIPDSPASGDLAGTPNYRFLVNKASLAKSSADRQLAQGSDHQDDQLQSFSSKESAGASEEFVYTAPTVGGISPPSWKYKQQRVRKVGTAYSAKMAA